MSYARAKALAELICPHHVGGCDDQPTRSEEVKSDSFDIGEDGEEDKLPGEGSTRGPE